MATLDAFLFDAAAAFTVAGPPMPKGFAASFTDSAVFRSSPSQPGMFDVYYPPPPGGGGDGLGPTVQNLTPAPGELPATSTPIEFDVIDSNPGGVLLTLVSVRYAVPLDGQVLLAYNGSTFEPPFTSLSTVVAIPDGLHFSLLPVGGWAGNIANVFVYATDSDGAVGALP